jgi:hypothetical protein
MSFLAPPDNFSMRDAGELARVVCFFDVFFFAVVFFAGALRAVDFLAAVLRLLFQPWISFAYRRRPLRPPSR